MTIEAFRTEFSIESWFDSWKAALGTPLTANEGDEGTAWAPSIRRLILESLSDASPEQFLNPLIANHLRHYGRGVARSLASDRTFWVRSEWSKVDVSYGLAEPFDIGNRRDWDNAWRNRKSGDLGQIEVKVCYEHLDRRGIAVLGDQLKRGRTANGNSGGVSQAEVRYHGLVWVFEHGDHGGLSLLTKDVVKAASEKDLTLVRGFSPVVGMDDLGHLWPSTNSESTYKCSMSVGLFELK